jgi:hypothetical protein
MGERPRGYHFSQEFAGGKPLVWVWVLILAIATVPRADDSVVIAFLKHRQHPGRAWLVVVEDETVHREKDKLGVFVQGSADEEQIRAWRSPAVARKRKGGMATAAKAPVGWCLTGQRPTLPAEEELGAVVLVGGAGRIPCAKQYHVCAVLPTPRHLFTWGNKIGVLQDPGPDFPW